MSRFSNYFAGVTERYKVARYKQVLSAFSDRQLEDMGFARGDIPRHAREMARRS